MTSGNLVELFTPDVLTNLVDRIGWQIHMGSIMAVLSASVAGVAGLVFMWWGIRKVVSMIMSAFRNGRLSL